MRNKLYAMYRFNSAPQVCKTTSGVDFHLNEPTILLKLHTPFWQSLFHSWYYVVDFGVVIDCKGYVEDRCLERMYYL